MEFNPDRIRSLAEVMPRFQSVVQPHDTVEMGIVGDDLYPYSNRTRPTATVMSVDRDASGVEIRMRNNETQEDFIIPRNNMDRQGVGVHPTVV